MQSAACCCRSKLPKKQFLPFSEPTQRRPGFLGNYIALVPNNHPSDLSTRSISNSAELTRSPKDFPAELKSLYLLRRSCEKGKKMPWRPSRRREDVRVGGPHKKRERAAVSRTGGEKLQDDVLWLLHSSVERICWWVSMNNSRPTWRASLRDSSVEGRGRKWSRRKKEWDGEGDGDGDGDDDGEEEGCRA